MIDSHNSQPHDSQPHNSQSHDSQSHDSQPHNSQFHDSQSHNSQTHDSQPHNSLQTEELLASYVLGDLTAEEVAKVNELLASRPELLEEVKHLQETLALLSFALPEDEPPQFLGSQILQAAKENNTENSLLSIAQKVSRRRKVWLGSAGAFAASFIVGLGFYSHHLQQKLVVTRKELSYYQETIALLRQPNNRLLSLKGIGKKFEASGSFVIVPSSGKGVLSLQNLSPLPEGKVYRLWAVTNGEKVDCGDFEVNPQGKALVQLPVDNSMVNISSALVTIEPLEPVSQPTGETVMRGGISL